MNFVKKMLFYLLIFFISGALLSAVVLDGYVKDINRRFLGNVKVSVVNGSAIVRNTLTDRNGYFKISVEEEIIKSSSIVFTSPSYYRMKIQLKKGKKRFAVILIPKEHMKEEITVTAFNSEKNSSETPMAEAVISKLELKERMPETVVEALSETPGVDFLGKGGHSITPSIRGLARRRVLMMLNGSRITSDRRVGTSASLILPGLIRRVEIARAATSVLYGSDAMGGVVNLFTGYPEGSMPPLFKLYLNGHSADSGKDAGATFYKSVDNLSFQAGYSFQKANDYSTPEGKVFHSGFRTSSGVATVKYGNMRREFFLTYFDGYGEDIGKPDRENDPANFTFNPLIRDRFLQFGYVEKSFSKRGKLTLRGFFNPSEYHLTKVKDNGNKLEKSFTSSENFGGKFFYSGNPGKKLELSLGLDWYGRRSVNIQNSVENNGENSSFFPLSDGRRDDLGLFATLKFTPVEHLDISGGLRLSSSGIEAVSSGEKRESSSGSPVFFLGAKGTIAKGLSAFFTLSRSFRVPSLSESYYTGLTGRKYVVGNPGLRPESSLSFDSGFKFVSSKLFVGVYLFRNRIGDLIERFRDEDGVYSYDNIVNGLIEGGEIEFQIFPKDKFEIFGHFYSYSGKSSADGTPLNDIPSAKIYLGSKVFMDRFWLELNIIHSFKKSRPGPAETFNDPYTVVNVKGGVYFSQLFFLHLKISNLTNRYYYANADPDIPATKGLGVSAGITINIR